MMALAPKRYAEVDQQLRQLQDELVALTRELGQVTPTSDHSCQPCQAAMKVAEQIADLRYLLAVAEARRQIDETKERSLPCLGQAEHKAGSEALSS